MRYKNHYVPRLLLRHWKGPDGTLRRYRLLVSDPRVPIWEEKRSTKKIAYQKHLYTCLENNGESDEIEKWLDREFEDPAKDALSKAVRDQLETSR